MNEKDYLKQDLLQGLESIESNYTMDIEQKEALSLAISIFTNLTSDALSNIVP